LLRAALIGFGTMGRNHARILKNLDQVELALIVDPIKPTHQIFPDVAWVESLEEYDFSTIDYCVISGPTSLHEEFVTKVIERRKPFLVEKPISDSIESANRILKLAELNDIKGAVGHIERFNPALLEAKKKINNGDLGEVLQISTRRQGPFPSRISDVGVTFDLASHDIDLTMWLVDSKYKSVGAITKSKDKNSVDDMILINGILQNGVIVNHIVNWLNPLKERSIQVIGKLGTFVIDTLMSDLYFHENGSVNMSQSPLAQFTGVTQGKTIKFAFEKPEPLLTEHIHFRDFVLGLDAQVAGLESATETIKVLTAALQSARESKVVKL
jgi:UDP-N-acetylglucosamine 3-dehydrogenase